MKVVYSSQVKSRLFIQGLIQYRLVQSSFAVMNMKMQFCSNFAEYARCKYFLSKYEVSLDSPPEKIITEFTQINTFKSLHTLES